MNTIKIEEYRESYLNKVNAILLKDINYIPEIRSSKHSLILLENETIIGIGSIWNNSIHPYREYISIYIVPEQRNKGLGKLLFHELESRYQLIKLQTALDSNNNNAVTFAQKCGFELGRKSYCYDVNKEILKPLEYNFSGKIIKMCNLTNMQLKNVINLQYEDYKLNHQKINPLNENMKTDDWKRIVIEDLAIEDSYVLIKNNDITAYLLCYKLDETWIEVGYTGNRCNNIKDYQVFLYEVMIQLFAYYNQIELEIDSCDKSANILGGLFSYNPNISWDTYIKDSQLF